MEERTDRRFAAMSNRDEVRISNTPDGWVSIRKSFYDELLAVWGDTMSNKHYWWMFFLHEWKANAVYTRMEPIYLPTQAQVETGVIVLPKTDVLYVCDCGKTKTVTLRGTWKLEEVRP